MKTTLRLMMLTCTAMLATSCTRDVYPKYLRMKQEAIWLEKTCVEGLANDTRYVYKGSGASIHISCAKPVALKPWLDTIETELLKVGWQLRKREAGVDTYCLKNENIYLIVVPTSDLERRSIVMSYPNNLCAQPAAT